MLPASVSEFPYVPVMLLMQGTICKKDGTLLAECLSKMMIVDETPQPSRKLAAGEGEEE